VLDAGLLPRRAYAAETAGQALVAAALGHGHRRTARDLAIPAGTVRGWIRGARRSAGQLRVTGIRAVVALDPDTLPTRTRPDELACALEHLAAAAMAMGSRLGLGTGLPGRAGMILALCPTGPIGTCRWDTGPIAAGPHGTAMRSDIRYMR
jgi:hypothetical protein